MLLCLLQCPAAGRPSRESAHQSDTTALHTSFPQVESSAQPLRDALTAVVAPIYQSMLKVLPSIPHFRHKNAEYSIFCLIVLLITELGRLIFEMKSRDNTFLQRTAKQQSHQRFKYHKYWDLILKNPDGVANSVSYAFALANWETDEIAHLMIFNFSNPSSNYLSFLGL